MSILNKIKKYVKYLSYCNNAIMQQCNNECINLKQTLLTMNLPSDRQSYKKNMPLD